MFRSINASQRQSKGDVRLMPEHPFIKRPFIEEDDRPERILPHSKKPFDLDNEGD